MMCAHNKKRPGLILATESNKTEIASLAVVILWCLRMQLSLTESESKLVGKNEGYRPNSIVSIAS